MTESTFDADDLFQGMNNVDEVGLDIRGGVADLLRSSGLVANPGILAAFDFDYHRS